jgi:hypothetical protein
MGKLAAGLALLAAAVLVGWFWLGREAVVEQESPPPTPYQDDHRVAPIPVEPEPQAAPLAIPEVAQPPLPLAPDWVLPSLNQSDGFVREQIATWGLPARWLGQAELVRHLAVLLENAARGEYPRRQLSFMWFNTAFRVIARDERLFLDPVNYQRFDALVDILAGVDPRQVARLLTFLDPLLAEALAELGVTTRPRTLLTAGLQRALALPDLPAEIELVRPNVFYLYADPALEGLTPLQKQLLRTGPENAARIQTWLRRLAGAMAIPVPAGPPCRLALEGCPGPG